MFLQRVEYLCALMIATTACLASLAHGADPVYLRVHVVQTTPAEASVQIRLEAYQKVWQRLCMVGLSRAGEILPINQRSPWSAMTEAHQLRAGQSTQWIDATELFAEVRGPAPESPRYLDPFYGKYAKPEQPKLLSFIFRTPDRPDTQTTRKSGNLERIELRIEFATAPDKQRIVATVHGIAEQGPLALFVPGMNDSLDDYAPNIVTLYDYAGARLEALRARGFTEQPLARRYLTSTWAKTWPQVYDRRAALREAEILRLLGCNVIKGLDDAPGVNAIDAQKLGVSLRFLELGAPPAEIRDPFIADVQPKLVAWLAAGAGGDPRAQAIRDDPSRRAFIKIEDEPHLFGVHFSGDGVESLRSEACILAFRRWLAARNIDPASIGCATLDEAEPYADLRRGITRSDLPDDAAAHRYYLTILFLQDATADFFKAYSSAVHEVFGEHCLTSTCVPYFTYRPPWFTFTYRPDHFLWSREHVMDVQMHHYTRNAWQTSEELLLYGQMLRSAAKFGHTQTGVLWGLSGPDALGSPQLSGMSALIRNVRNFYQYYYEPTQHAWDDDDVDAYAAMGRIYQLAARIEDITFEGDSPMRRAQVALLHSRGSEIWTQKGLYTEHRMLAGALAYNQVPFDVIPEEDAARLLANYRVVYLLDPHLDAAARAALSQWVRDGGVLFTVAEAGLRDELDRPSAFMRDLAPQGSRFELIDAPDPHYNEIKKLAELPRLGTARWDDGQARFDLEIVAKRERMRVDGATVLARDAEGEPLALEFAAGRGRVIRVGTLLGTALARSATPAFTDPVEHDARIYDENLYRIYLRPLEVARIERELAIDAAGIDATWFEKDGRAVLLMANYRTATPLDVTVRARFAEPMRRCRTMEDESLDVRHEDGWTIVESVPIDHVQALFFER